MIALHRMAFKGFLGNFVSFLFLFSKTICYFAHLNIIPLPVLEYNFFGTLFYPDFVYLCVLFTVMIKLFIFFSSLFVSICSLKCFCEKRVDWLCTSLSHTHTHTLSYHTFINPSQTRFPFPKNPLLIQLPQMVRAGFMREREREREKGR